MKNKKFLSSLKGLTLVELLVTLSIIALLATWASSDSADVRQREKIDRVAQNLMDSIHFSQDYSRHLSVPSALCAGTAADQCTSADWRNGWTLFRANSQSANSPLEAVRTFEPNTSGLHVAVTGLTTNGKIIINGEGFIIPNNVNTRAVICHKDQPYYATLNMSATQTELATESVFTTISEQCQNETI